MKYFIFTFILSCSSLSLAMAKAAITGQVLSYDAKTITLKEPGGQKLIVPRKNYPKLKGVVPGKSTITVFVTITEMKALNPKFGSTH